MACIGLCYLVVFKDVQGSGLRESFFLICFWSHGSFHWKALTKWLAVPLCQVLRDTSAGLALRACGRPLRSSRAKDTEGQLRVQLGSYHVPEIWEALLYSAVPTKMTYTMPLEAPWESNLPTQLQDLFRRSRVTKSIGTFWQLGFKRLDIYSGKHNHLVLLQTTCWTDLF